MTYSFDDPPPRHRKSSKYVVRRRPQAGWLSSGLSARWCHSKAWRTRFKSRRRAIDEAKAAIGSDSWFEVLVCTKNKERVVYSTAPLLDKLAELAD